MRVYPFSLYISCTAELLELTLNVEDFVLRICDLSLQLIHCVKELKVLLFLCHKLTHNLIIS